MHTPRRRPGTDGRWAGNSVGELRCSGSTPWLWRYETDAVELGWAMKRRGELYEEKGETTKAAAAFAGLVKLWGRADPELQTVVAPVRQRAERNRALGAD
jgi:hypothetical protein